jgi:hypothetical protein
MGSDDKVPTGNDEVDLVADALSVRRLRSVKGSLLVARQGHATAYQSTTTAYP